MGLLHGLSSSDRLRPTRFKRRPKTRCLWVSRAIGPRPPCCHRASASEAAGFPGTVRRASCSYYSLMGSLSEDQLSKRWAWIPSAHVSNMFCRLGNSYTPWNTFGCESHPVPQGTSGFQRLGFGCLTGAPSNRHVLVHV